MTAGVREKKTKHEDVYTAVEFARLFGCSLRHTQNLCDMGLAEGGIESYRVGKKGSYRIPKTELIRLRNEMKTTDLNHTSSACTAGGM